MARPDSPAAMGWNGEDGVTVRGCTQDPRCSHTRVAREPVTAIEGILCVCFADALGVCRVGADDDFFALGGDRPAAVHMISSLRRQVGVPVQLRWLQDHPTPQRLAQRVRRDGDHRLGSSTERS